MQRKADGGVTPPRRRIAREVVQQRTATAVARQRELDAQSRLADDVVALHFSGGRYDEPGFPLDGIEELGRYQRLVIEAAKMIWRKRNPIKKNLPVRFADQVRLRLTHVEEGSVAPVLQPEPRLALPHAPDLLDQAISLVDGAFEGIVSRHQLPDDVTDEFGTAAKAFGGSLLGNEAATFRSGKTQSFSYTAAIRKAFIDEMRNLGDLVDGTLIGTIRVLDNDRRFTLEDIDGNEIPGRFTSDSTFEALREVHRLRDQAELVWLTCSYYLNADNDEVCGIADVREAGLFAPRANAWARPLAHLAYLRPGWLDGGGVAIEVTAILAARQILDQVTEDADADPSLFGDEDGGVRLEWLTHESHTVLSIDNDVKYSGYFLNISTHVEDGFEDGDSKAALAFLSGRVHD